MNRPVPDSTAVLNEPDMESFQKKGRSLCGITEEVTSYVVTGYAFEELQPKHEP